MSDALIYYGYTPRKRRWECAPSVRAMLDLEGRGYRILWLPCPGPTDYADGLGRVWDHPGDLLIVEHDIAPTAEMVEEMLGCSREICTRPYWTVLGVTGYRPLLSCFVERFGPRIQPGETSAGYTGIGMAKLSRAARRRGYTPRPVVWTDVEFEVNRAAEASGRWHVHWPIVPHHHGFRREEQRYDVDALRSARAAANPQR